MLAFSRDEMSTEDTTAKSDGPVAAQSASSVGQAVAGYQLLRSQVLVWLGILGGVLTVFSNIGKILTLSDWAHWIVKHWHAWTHSVWLWLFSWIGVHIPYEIAPTLTFV